MVENVLTVAGTVFQLAELFNKFRMYAVDACVNSGSFTCLLNGVFNLTLGFFVQLLDPCRVDSAVCNELFKRKSCDFTANGIKTRYRDRFGRIVDNKIDSRNRFKSSYISSLTTDYTTFHLIVGQGNDRNGGVRTVICGAALNCRCNNFTSFLVCFILCFLLVFHNLDRFLVDEIGLKSFEQIILSLFLVEA